MPRLTRNRPVSPLTKPRCRPHSAPFVVRSLDDAGKPPSSPPRCRSAPRLPPGAQILGSDMSHLSLSPAGAGAREARDVKRADELRALAEAGATQAEAARQLGISRQRTGCWDRVPATRPPSAAGAASPSTLDSAPAARSGKPPKVSPVRDLPVAPCGSVILAPPKRQACGRSLHEVRGRPCLRLARGAVRGAAGYVAMRDLRSEPG